MKKHILPLLLLLCLTLSACTAPTSSTQPISPTPEATQPTSSPAEASEEPSVPPQDDTTSDPFGEATPQASTPTEAEIQSRVSTMLPLLDSLIRTTGIDGEIPYAPKDAEYVWTALYLWGVNFGQATHSQVSCDEHGEVTVPRNVMQEVASAMFFEYDDLPEIPASLKPSVSYDESLDAYLLAASDMGETSCQILKFEKSEENSLVVDVTMTNDVEKKTLGTMRFHIVENPYASGISEPLFYYTVDSMKGITE